MKQKTFTPVCQSFLFIFLLMFALSCKKDTADDPNAIKNGKWMGHYTGINTSDAIIFNIKDGKITTSGSTIIDFTGRTCCMWIKIYAPGTTSTAVETSFIQDIQITNGLFSGGSTTPGNLSISGTFAPGNICTGKVTYYFSSGNTEFYFEAKPQ
jgi:hypothetical protein